MGKSTKEVKEVKKKEVKATKQETQKQQIIKLFMKNTLISTDDIVAGVGCSDKYAKEVLRNIWMEPEIQQSPPLGLVTGTNILRSRNKVSIVGFAPSSMRDVRHVWDDPDMEVWGINQLYMPGAFPAIVEKATRWFQIHHRSSYDQTVDRDITHHEWMSKQDGFPIYMQKQWEDIPMSVPFPKEEILQHYRKYFTNTITWMIVLAHYEGFKECHLYGIDMAQDCVAPETKILTADSEWKPAGEIKVGEKILGFSEYDHLSYESSEVEEANILTRPSCKIKFSNGCEVVASIGHQWLVCNHHIDRTWHWERTDSIWRRPQDFSFLHYKDGNPVTIEKIEIIGDQKVVGFKTSTKTFIAEGLCTHNSEYAFERPSVEWACGLFDGDPNKTIVLPEKSDICKSAFLYPFDETAPLKTKIQSRREELRGRLNHHSAEEQNNRDARMQCIGGLDNMNYIEKTWMHNASRIEMPSTDMNLNKPQQEN